MATNSSGGCVIVKKKPIKGMPKWFQQWESNHFHSLEMKVKLNTIITLAILAALIGVLVARALG